MKILNIIDSFGFFFRLFYAMNSLKSSDGKPSGMVNGFANFISKLKSDFASDYIVFALDSGGDTFRSKIYPNYKKNRQSPPNELKEQLSVCIQMIQDMGFASLGIKGYEADDIIASFVRAYKSELKINILSHDKDLYQLIDENVSIISPATKTRYNRDGCYEKYGIYPEQVRDFLAITGDTSDNIPGVRGIGDKGAKTLLQTYTNLENIYANIDQIANERSKKCLIQSKENAFLSRQLVELYDKLEVLNLQDCLYPASNPLERVIPTLQSYSLNKILSSLNLSAQAKNLNANNQNFNAQNPNFNAQKNQENQTNTNQNFTPPTFTLISDENALNSALDSINENSKIALNLISSTQNSYTKITGFSFAFNLNQVFYVSMGHNYLVQSTQISQSVAKRALERILKAKVISHNIKDDFEILKNSFNFDLAQNYADTMILAWLSDPQSKLELENLASKILNYQMLKHDPKQGNFSSMDPKICKDFACQRAYITLRLYEHFMLSLPQDLLKLANELEFPFIRTLFNMQQCGITLNIQATKNLSNSLQERIRGLRDEIYALANESFNINSPKQLASVLFSKLGLEASKKTKTGYSTDESVLLAIKNAHPIVPKILEYRELFKLESTYCQPLITLASKDAKSKIYTHFSQTGTATGRLSSANPNLQNIPARGDLANDMRSCFIARDGYILASLDYSQIELRLLAHFSGDQALLRAFKNGEDIHMRTAISIFKDDLKEHRAIAKSINFGLIYGMGARRLASQLNISTQEAKDYIARYFNAFGTVKSYLSSIKDSAHKNGFVSTILGRKRIFDFAFANEREIAMYEREAVNTVFQGSAADIIKLAMNKITPLLNDDFRLILQIHDELIFELKQELASTHLARAQEIMQNACALSVPLLTTLSTGKTWGQLK